MSLELNFIEEFKSDIDNLQKSKEYYTNNIHRYPAKMVKFIPQLLIPRLVSKNNVILDPFCGSGTVLMNARLLGINSIGIDVNPLAVLISKVKTEKYNPIKLKKYSTYLLNSINNFRGNIEIPNFPNRDFWFEKKYQRQLGKIITNIKKIPKGKYRNFFLLCFSTIIRRSSNADPDIFPPVKTKKMRKTIENRNLDIIRMFEASIQKNMERTLNFSRECLNNNYVKVLEKDSRKIPLKNNSIDLVFSSPPYISAQKYARSLKLEMYWLGLVNKNKFDKVDEDTIGTERVKTSSFDDLFVGISSIDKYNKLIWEKDRNCAIIFSNYFKDMSKIISEIKRVLKKSGHFVLVIGNNTIKGFNIPSNILINEIAKRNKLTLVEQYYDTIRYRGFMKKRNKTAGIIDTEWIMIFKKD